jgi:hypothetical protein
MKGGLLGKKRQSREEFEAEEEKVRLFNAENIIGN